MRHIEAVMWEDTYRKIIRFLGYYGYDRKPRGYKTRELCPFSFSIEQSRQRVISWKKRNWRDYVAFSEFLWIMSGSDLLEDIIPFNKAWANFSDDGKHLHGAYGKRLKCCVDQIELAINMLKKDPYTRQAVIHIHNVNDLTVVSKDIPCTCSLQFINERGSLDCVVYMRSNDVILGVAYDMFVFSMIQEYVALSVGLNPGKYTHITGSMHIYEDNFDYFEACDEPVMFSEIKHMKKMDLENINKAIGIYFILVGSNPEKQDVESIAKEIVSMPDYWRYILSVLYNKFVSYHKIKNCESIALEDSMIYQNF